MKSHRLTILLLVAIFFMAAAARLKIVSSQPPEKTPYVLSRFQQAADPGLSLSPLERPGSSSPRKKPIHLAKIEDISAVSGFGEKLSGRVIAKIEEKGEKITEADICDVSGIGEARLSALKEHFLIPSGPEETRGKDRPLSEASSQSAVCPRCGRSLTEHNRKQKSRYIYCPHCLEYLPARE